MPPGDHATHRWPLSDLALALEAGDPRASDAIRERWLDMVGRPVMLRYYLAAENHTFCGEELRYLKLGMQFVRAGKPAAEHALEAWKWVNEFCELTTGVKVELVLLRMARERDTKGESRGEKASEEK